MQGRSSTGSAQRFVEIWRKLESWDWTLDEDDRLLELADARRTCALWGAARDGGQMNKTSVEDGVSPPYVETFNSKLIKRFCTWTGGRYVFSNFEIPMFYRYEHYMSISHIALIVNMVQRRFTKIFSLSLSLSLSLLLSFRFCYQRPQQLTRLNFWIQWWWFSYCPVIIIIIMSHRHRGSPWPSPATRLYRLSLPVGLQGYILYRHRAIVYRF